MELPPAEPLQLWFDADNAPVVTMDPAEDVSGWALAVEIADAATGVVLLTLTSADSDEVDLVGGGTGGAFTFYLNPSAEGLDAATPYTYRALRTDAGARDVLAYGPLTFKSLAL